MGFLQTVFWFLVAIGLLVVIHEYGHYWAARRCGVRVLRFAVGFGRPIWQRTAKDGTEWVIGSIPLGGYVRMLDERDSDFVVPPEARDQAFNNKRVGQKMFIVAAGPLANFLLAIVLYSGLYLSGVEEAQPVLDGPAASTMAASAGIRSGDRVLAVDGVAVTGFSQLRWHLLESMIDRQPASLEIRRSDGRLERINLALDQLAAREFDQDLIGQIGLRVKPEAVLLGTLVEGGAASTAGLLAGDRVLAVDGLAIDRAEDLITTIRASAGQTLTMTVERNGMARTLKLAPRGEAGADGKVVGRIGAAIQVKLPMTTVQYGFFESLQRSMSRTWDTSVLSLRMMGRIITGDISWKNLSGPVAIADVAGQSAKMGIEPYIAFLAMISISLGVLNLLPIPVLDGGHLLYHLAEAIRGAPLPLSVLEVGQRIGVAMIVALTGVALFNDLTRLFGAL